MNSLWAAGMGESNQRLGESRPQSGAAEVVTVFGYILAVSYPILALSTGVRALFQLFIKEDVANYLAPGLSLVAAVCYLTATIGFARRERWGWWLSVGVLSLETTLTLVVGGLSLAFPELIGRTVWRHFGADYGYFPLFQPLIGLVWLLWPATMRQYGVRFGWAALMHAPIADGTDE